MKFPKPALSIDDQIDLLRRRGMGVPDTAKARHYLQHVSYYRLRAYWLPFEHPALRPGEHLFATGATFDDALDLYVFDRRLRLLVMDAIERIEVSLRGAWAHHLAMTYGPHGYLDPAIYDRTDWYAKAFVSLSEEVARSKDTFIVHYKTKYGDPELPPVWMTAEVMSLGQLSKWLGNLKRRADRNAIARPYGLDEKIVISAAHHLTYVRNICAHHGRLWNKQFTVTMSIPRSPPRLAIAMAGTHPRKLHNTLVVVGYLMDIIAPHTGWKRGVVNLIAEYPKVDTAAMGFPDGWDTRPAWTV